MVHITHLKDKPEEGIIAYKFSEGTEFRNNNLKKIIMRFSITKNAFVETKGHIEAQGVDTGATVISEGIIKITGPVHTQCRIESPKGIILNGLVSPNAEIRTGKEGKIILTKPEKVSRLAKFYVGKELKTAKELTQQTEEFLKTRS